MKPCFNCGEPGEFLHVSDLYICDSEECDRALAEMEAERSALAREEAERDDFERYR